MNEKLAGAISIVITAVLAAFFFAGYKTGEYESTVDAQQIKESISVCELSQTEIDYIRGGVVYCINGISKVLE